MLYIYHKANILVVYWYKNYFFNSDMLKLLLSLSLKSKPSWLYSFKGNGENVTKGIIIVIYLTEDF